MSKLGEKLQPWDMAYTDINQRIQRVRITDRLDHCVSQSGIMFRVSSQKGDINPNDWIDSHWFDPVEGS